MRDVRLRDGLDELGLERLSSVIQSTVVALREGSEGSDRETFESQLRGAGVDVSAATPPATPIGPVEPTGPPRASRVATPVPARDTSRFASLEMSREGRSSRSRKLGPRFDIGYGARAGGERFVHGPSLVLAWPVLFQSHLLWLELRAGAFFPRSADAAPFELSLQTSTLRAGVGIENRARSNFRGYAAVVGGVDRVRVDSRLSGNATDLVERYRASSSTRLWGELGVVAGVWYRAKIDVGLFGALDYCVSDVSYVVATPQGDERVLSSSRWQPALFVAMRFGVTSSE